MCESKLSAKVSVEKVVHDVITEILNGLAKDYGLYVEQVSVNWHRTTVGQPRRSVSELNITTSTPSR